ncbi:hypothetical protein D7Y13_14985 [Corallococcus praedator]|uniref:Tox-REase-5 domain-containing protein n=2 Tax=Myxococcaceae TaxID=31 RepID=A0ABX9QKK5_9BACT|nr:hypothetical protein D7X75_22370 [Corallococcus sp. CA031C]RKI09049.1 hypothetical protein D7Y13_14985 [Corallococcus praedator]
MTFALLTTGCASLTPPSNRGRDLGYAPRAVMESTLARRVEEAPPPPDITHGTAPEVDGWEQLLTDAGLEAHDPRPLPGGSLAPAQAARLLGELLGKPVTLRTFPPRLTAGFLLREVMKGGGVSRQELLRRVERFNHGQVAVLRPDGYLARATNGWTQQKVGTVEWKDGAFRAGHFELGRFYNGRRGIFLPVDDQLRAVDGPPLAEVYSDADVINRSLDGAEDAFVELYHVLGQFLSHPTDTLLGLRDLPSGVAALIASSPEYLERFLLMTRGEQLREAARLTTSLLITGGGASVTTRALRSSMAGAEALVPVLSLSAEGALGLERVAMPVGRMAEVLSGGAGAAIILQRANMTGGTASPPGGPGRWKPARENMSEEARQYQAQVAGAPSGLVYEIDDVRFDGFRDGILLEAKGPNYSKFLPDAAEQGGWFQGFREMVTQARRQKRVAQGNPIHWHFAERDVADFVRRLFVDNNLGDIHVFFTAAR